jgi:hypothetical protein
VGGGRAAPSTGDGAMLPKEERMAKVPKRRQAVDKMVDGNKRYTLDEATSL